jgi:phosphatidate cytidylyltransferase
MKDISKRILTAIIMIIIVVAAIQWLPPLYFALFLYLVISGTVWELVQMVKPASRSFLLIFFNGAVISVSFVWSKLDLLPAVVFTLISTGIFMLFSIRKEEKLSVFVKDFGLHLTAYFYLYVPLFFIYKLKLADPFHLFFLILVILVGDSAALFIGSLLGKHQAYPVASPNKTIEGVVAAVLFAGLAGVVGGLLFPINASLIQTGLAGAVMGLLSQISDPIESLFKRACKKKDSGTLLPGHGGLLDRLDSYIFCAPVLFYLIEILWRS